jgi:hypothetical protein
MILAFTICSINYLAQARTLGDSLRRTNPGWRYVIGLVDRLDAANLPADLIPEYPLLEVHTIGITDLAEMGKRYDITELNTAVKPFFIDYLFRHEPTATAIVYFDPDIIVYQPLTRLQHSLRTRSIVLTPHLCSPLTDHQFPTEQQHLNTGTFNLGFIGLRRDETARQFVRWWQHRLRFDCRIDLCAGLFVDQHWVSFAPVYFDNVLIEKHTGYNVAYWNLHERGLFERDGQWWVAGIGPVSPGGDGSPDAVPLQFLHYSGYNPAQPLEVSKYQDRFTFAGPEPGQVPTAPTPAYRPDAWPLFDYYGQQLRANGNETYRTYRCFYIKPARTLLLQRVRRAINKPLRQAVRWLDQSGQAS